MNHNYTYDVFISHNFNQKDWVQKFVEILKILGIQTFFDPEDMEFGENTFTGVMSGLEYSDKLVFIISPESVNSEWVACECLVMLNRDPSGKRKIIIPVLLKPVEESQCFF